MPAGCDSIRSTWCHRRCRDPAANGRASHWGGSHPEVSGADRALRHATFPELGARGRRHRSRSGRCRRERRWLLCNTRKLFGAHNQCNEADRDEALPDQDRPDRPRSIARGTLASTSMCCVAEDDGGCWARVDGPRGRLSRTVGPFGCLRRATRSTRLAYDSILTGRVVHLADAGVRARRK